MTVQEIETLLDKDAATISLASSDLSSAYVPFVHPMG
jgi:hypothetical protein